MKAYETELTFASEKGQKLSFPWPIPKPFPDGQEPLCNSYPQVTAKSRYTMKDMLSQNEPTSSER